MAQLLVLSRRYAPDFVSPNPTLNLNLHRAFGGSQPFVGGLLVARRVLPARATTVRVVLRASVPAFVLVGDTVVATLAMTADKAVTETSNIVLLPGEYPVVITVVALNSQSSANEFQGSYMTLQLSTTLALWPIVGTSDASSRTFCFRPNACPLYTPTSFPSWCLQIGGPGCHATPVEASNFRLQHVQLHETTGDLLVFPGANCSLTSNHSVVPDTQTCSQNVDGDAGLSIWSAERCTSAHFRSHASTCFNNAFNKAPVCLLPCSPISFREVGCDQQASCSNVTVSPCKVSHPC